MLLRLASSVHPLVVWQHICQTAGVLLPHLQGPHDAKSILALVERLMFGIQAALLSREVSSRSP
jgi:hypothetical protein